jgi:hypothetical protein
MLLFIYRFFSLTTLSLLFNDLWLIIIIIVFHHRSVLPLFLLLLLGFLTLGEAPCLLRGIPQAEGAPDEVPQDHGEAHMPPA